MGKTSRQWSTGQATKINEGPSQPGQTYQTHHRIPNRASACSQFPFLFATIGLNLRVRHEAFQGIKTLLQGLFLNRGQVGIQQTTLELLIIEPRSVLLLLGMKFSQNTEHGVHVERHGAISLTDSHQIEHPLSIQIRFVNLKGLDLHVVEARVRVLISQG